MEFERAGDFIINKLKQALPPKLTYHNVEHTCDVYLSAETIGKAENISAADMRLLLTAALYHDTGFLVKAEAHEEESCKIATGYLPLFGFTEDEINTVCRIIMATKIPQSPKTQLESILADADLDYLGREDFFKVGHRLYNELTNLGILDTEYEWNKLQLEFMQAHKYFTSSAINLRQAGKEKNIVQIRKQLLTQIDK